MKLPKSKYFILCPQCEKYRIVKFSRNTNGIRYICEICRSEYQQAELLDIDKTAMGINTGVIYQLRYRKESNE